MKNMTFVVFCLWASSSIFSQRISDPNMVSAIRWQCPECIDTSGNLTAHAQTIRSITLTNHITDLTGIGGFSNLSSLNVADNDLTVLPNLPPNLTTFRCSNNFLTQLPVLPKNLIGFYCYGNRLTNIPDLPKNLRFFNCSNNQLTSLPALPNTLEGFYCSYNNLTTLPFLPNTLTDMGCASNNLTSLPDLPPNIFLLSCFSNPLLKCLPKLPMSLKYLELSATLTCLPNLVPELSILRFDANVFNTIVMPLCANTRPNPCGPTTDIKEGISENIRIFPSFTEGVLDIESDNVLIEKILVFNDIGQLLMQTNTTHLDISKFPSGIYFIGLQVGGTRVMRKIVKL